MEFKGTKSPWNVQNELTVWGDEINDRVCIVDESKNIQTGLRSDVCRANVKLIAAAPDLLEACIDLIDSLQPYLMNCEAIMKGKKAIEKALK